MKQTLQTEPPKLKLDLKEDGLTFLTIALVCLIQGVAISGFYVPHSFLGGGVTGISMLINYITGLPTWPFIILLNIPILLIGCKYLRIKSVLFSLVATLLLSVAMGFTSGLDFGVKDPLVSAAAGASIVGISGSLVVRRDATMGGTDIIAAIISRNYSIPMGTINIFFNLVIMSVLAFVKGLETALVSMICMFICNVAFNAALKGMNRVMTLFIISEKWRLYRRPQEAGILYRTFHRIGQGAAYGQGARPQRHVFHHRDPGSGGPGLWLLQLIPPGLLQRIPFPLHR